MENSKETHYGLFKANGAEPRTLIFLKPKKTKSSRQELLNHTKNICMK